MDSIHALLQSRKTEDRIRGMQRLARSPEPDDLPLLLAGLSDKSHYVGALAAEGLGLCADLPAMAIMIDKFVELSADGLKLDPGCHIRAHLAYAFGILESLHADTALRIGIRTIQIEAVGGVRYDTGAHLRANCALALAQMRSTGALREITLLLFDHGSGQIGAGDARNNLVEPRKAAARALGLLSTAEARVPLTLRLRYPIGESAEVLQECMQALVDLEDPDLKETLYPFIIGKDIDADLAVYAGLMLATARVEGAEQLLGILIDQFSGNALRAAILALTTLRTPEAAKLLDLLKTHGRRAVRDAWAEIENG